uniref:Putative secreted protein n=1 Tax=Anopheles darlingi TaxID=43151 RepID=A0A2M4DG04_ANODA
MVAFFCFWQATVASNSPRFSFETTPVRLTGRSHMAVPGGAQERRKVNSFPARTKAREGIHRTHPPGGRMTR